MTASFAITPQNPRARRHGAAVTIAIAIIVGSTVFGLLIGAITFGALAIAFPLAVPIAEQYHVSVSPNDMHIAEQFSHLWWVFAAISVASLVAAAMVVVKTVSYLAPRKSE